MKSARLALCNIICLVAASTAYAVDTTQVYNSGLLVLLFVGFCALVVLVQVVPAAVLFSGMVSAVAKLFRERKEVRVETEK